MASEDELCPHKSIHELPDDPGPLQLVPGERIPVTIVPGTGHHPHTPPAVPGRAAPPLHPVHGSGVLCLHTTPKPFRQVPDVLPLVKVIPRYMRFHLLFFIIDVSFRYLLSCRVWGPEKGAEEEGLRPVARAL